MNDKTCIEIGEAILSSDGKWPAAVQDHIQKCSACQSLAVSWVKLREAELPAVEDISPSLDFAILCAAEKTQKQHRWMLPKWFYAISSAACAIMFAWLVVHSHIYSSQQQLARRKNSINEQFATNLDYEIEFNRVFSNIDSALMPENNNHEIDDIVQSISGDSSDNELFETLSQTAREVESLLK